MSRYIGIASYIHKFGERGLMTSVFISYSRKDKDFTQRLFDRLAEQGRDAWVDWEGIPYSVDWWREICAGIDGAETFICIISPDALASMVCNQEIAYARENHKRVIPVLHRPVEEKQIAGEWFGKEWENTARENWAELKRLNWLFFREDDDFDTAFHELLRTAEADPEHLKFHTRLLVRAREWNTSVKHDSGLLLRGDDLRQAENWLQFNNSKNPLPTELHTAYIQESLNLRAEEELAERRQRERLRLLVVALSVLLMVAVGASVLAVNRSQLADANAQTAVANAATATSAEGRALDEAENARIQAVRAEQNAATATVALGEAAINLRQAWDTQSLFLADLSTQQLEAGFQQTSLLLALESLAHYPEINHEEASSALVNALSYPAQERLLMEHKGWVAGADYNADRTRLLSWSDDGLARVWDAADGQPLLTMKHDTAVSGARWNPDETRILTWGYEPTVQIWDSESGVLLMTLPHELNLREAAWSADGTRILTRAENSFSVWDSATGERLLALEHDSIIYGFVLDQDEKRLLTWTGDFAQRTGTLYLWDISLEAATSATQHLKLAHNDVVSGAIWNADETRILSWTSSTWATVWDAETGDELLRLEHLGAINKAMWNADESRILSISMDGRSGKGTLYVWDVQSGEALLTLPHDVNLWGAIWNRDETRILSWSSDASRSGGTVTLWDANTGNLLLRLPHSNWVNGARWNADETRILSWSSDGTAVIWDQAGKPLSIFAHPYGVFDAEWIAGETQLLTRSGETAQQSGGVRVWDISSAAKLFTARHEQYVPGAVWSRDGSQILSVSSDGTARIWDAATGREQVCFAQTEAMRTAAWNPDETRVVTSGDDNHARVWDAGTGEELLAVQHQGRVFGAIWNRASTQILTWSEDSTAQVWDIGSGSAVLNLPHDSPVWGGVWNADQSRIMTWGMDGKVHLWDAATGESMGILQHSVSVYGAAWDPDETRILTWSASGSGGNATVSVWDAASGELLYSLPHNSFVYAAWSPNGDQILSWSNLPTFENGFANGVAVVWDAESGDEIHTLSHTFTVQNAQWSADGTRIVTVSANAFGQQSVVKIWDAASGEAQISLPQNGIVGAAWKPDATQILVWGMDGELWTWPVLLQDWITRAQSHIIRPLTDEERARFFLPAVTPAPTAALN